MSTNGHRKWSVDSELVKAWEWTDVLNAVGGIGLQDAMSGPRSVETMCAIAWVLARRDDPDAAWADFRDLTMADLDMAGASNPEVPGGNSGEPPRLSPVSGA